MKIYLIGMPGSGKTTLGKALATEMMMDFVDLDHEIEKREQKSIPEIFNQQGEDYFRQVESVVLLDWAASAKNFVMATGGGTPCFNEGIEVIKKTGISIFLDVPIAQLVERVEKESNRPLLQGHDREALKTRLEQLMKTRRDYYRRATFSIQNPTLPLLLERLRVKN